MMNPTVTPFDPNTTTGTPPGGGSQLSVMSYNILADVFVRPISKETGLVVDYAAFPWAEPADEVLDWEARHPRILHEIHTAKVYITPHSPPLILPSSRVVVPPRRM